MAKYLLLVVSNPVPGRVEEYNRWYSDVHLGEVLQVPGFVGARRFQVVAQPSDNPICGSYVALYEMDCEDPVATYASLGTATDAGRIRVSDALDTVNISITVLRPL